MLRLCGRGKGIGEGIWDTGNGKREIENSKVSIVNKFGFETKIYYIN